PMQTMPGQIIGTPPYMSPEQARGELANLDERCDVFSLGAILCEILTGQPPFLGENHEEVLDKACRGDLTEPLTRLNNCGADAELVRLAKACLAVCPDQRPRDAGVVAKELAAYLAGVQERLRLAELERAQAQIKAQEQRKRRRLTVALAASVLTLLLLTAGGWMWIERQKTSRIKETADK